MRAEIKESGEIIERDERRRQRPRINERDRETEETER